MMKIAKYLSVILLCMTFTACSSTAAAPTPVPSAVPTPTPYAEITDAGNLLNQLKEVDTNVGTIVVYTAKTDPNRMLGRPGYYI